MSSTSISTDGDGYKPRLLVKSLPLGYFKIRLDKKDKKFIQKLRDDITDFDPTIDVLTLNEAFGSTGWLQVPEQLFLAIRDHYDLKKVRSRIKVGR